MESQQHARRCLVGLCVVGWVTVTGAILRTAPQDEGRASSFDRGFLDELLDHAGSLPRLRSLLISIDGENSPRNTITMAPLRDARPT